MHGSFADKRPAKHQQGHHQHGKQHEGIPFVGRKTLHQKEVEKHGCGQHHHGQQAGEGIKRGCHKDGCGGDATVLHGAVEERQRSDPARRKKHADQVAAQEEHGGHAQRNGPVHGAEAVHIEQCLRQHIDTRHQQSEDQPWDIGFQQFGAQLQQSMPFMPEEEDSQHDTQQAKGDAQRAAHLHPVPSGPTTCRAIDRVHLAGAAMPHHEREP